MSVTTRLFEDLWVNYQPERAGAADFWDKRAPSFNDHVRRDASREHRRHLVGHIARKAQLAPSGAVLDIGCGPGSHALEMAPLAGSVEGFDLSSKMVELAKENAARDGCANAHFQVLDWGKADLDSLGWRKKFQLVLASRTPAVNDRAALEKMIAASCGYCCMISQVDTRHSVRDRLKALVDWDAHKERISRSFYCAFNLLWLMGHYPEVEYMDRAWESDSSLEEAELMYLRFFESMGPLTGQQKESLTRALAEISRDGRVHESVQSKVAIMFWAV
ncbi:MULTISPECIES: class I SAM-dependent DNA methyltransferase [unclassified Desulfovibrio]|uniref:class I SAM-dependent DNA methyltransferase n=1 Tax=unclassified Desulfovibrio TaxID=2593640 RepID=UPI002FD8DC2D